MSYDPRTSVITPFEFEHDGTKHAIGAWLTPASTYPLFSIVRLEGDGKWRSFGGGANELNQERVNAFGGAKEYIKHHIDNWNKYHFSDEVEIPDSFLDGFADYLQEHLIFDGKLRIE